MLDCPVFIRTENNDDRADNYCKKAFCQIASVQLRTSVKRNIRCVCDTYDQISLLSVFHALDCAPKTDYVRRYSSIHPGRHRLDEIVFLAQSLAMITQA